MRFIRKWLFILFPLFLKAEFGIIIGGSYAAFVDDSGVATLIPGLPIGGGVYNAVNINNQGDAIADNILISSSGVVTPMTGDIAMGSFIMRSAGINESGNGIQGGGHFFTTPYLATVTPTGIASAVTGAIPGGLGEVRAVAINDSDQMIAGGSQGLFNVPYLATINSSGTATLVTGDAPTVSGSISGVDIISTGEAIAVGDDVAGFYVATISPAGVATRATGFTPAGTGTYNAVAMNENRQAIAGGSEVAFNTPFAVMISPSGVVSSLTGAVPTGMGFIEAVDINSTGDGIIGGSAGTNESFYALVSSTGVVTAITGATPSGVGRIRGVAIDEVGISLAVGDDGGGGYAALVSPSGVATLLTGDLTTLYTGAAVKKILQAVTPMIVPASFGGGSTFATAAFALSSQILPNYLMKRHKIPYYKKVKSQKDEISLALAEKSRGLLASARDQLHYQPEEYKDVKYTLWGSLFGDYTHQDRIQNTPSLDNWVAGAILGFDYRGVEDIVIGGGAAYAYNYVHFSENAGHSRAHQEFVTLYTSYDRKNFYINTAIWGGLYQLENTRRSIGTSKADITGWILVPHIEMSTPFFAKGTWFMIDPFFMMDWANNWQGKVRESGASGFNIEFGHQYTSLLRSEAGLRFYEMISFGWGQLILVEKGSWVNRKPFNTSAVTTSFIGSNAPFTISVFNGKVQNLGAVQFNMEFVPKNPKYPFGLINYQGEFGANLQSHLISFEIGKDF